MHLYFYLKVFPPNGKILDRGISKAVDGLAGGLEECGVKVTIFCENDRESYYQVERGYHIRCFAQTSKNDKLFLVSNKLKLHIKQNSPDLVILNGVFHPSVYVLSRCLKKTQIPYIVCPHDPYHPSIFSKNGHLKMALLVFPRKTNVKGSKSSASIRYSSPGIFKKVRG